MWVRINQATHLIAWSSAGPHGESKIRHNHPLLDKYTKFIRTNTQPKLYAGYNFTGIPTPKDGDWYWSYNDTRALGWYKWTEEIPEDM